MCLRKGWNSVLSDGSSLPVAENQRQTVEIVAEARSYGAHVEGEIEAITGVEDGIGSDEVGAAAVPGHRGRLPATAWPRPLPPACQLRDHGERVHRR